MDSLALLCNLYGDGPQTLRRLREAGCGTLAALESIESERLASLLRTSARAAKRFQTEGRLLRERSEPAPERAAKRRSNDASQNVEPAANDPLLAPVLIAWRDRDARVGSDLPASGPAPLPDHSSHHARHAREDGSDLGGLEGLDAVLLDRLHGAGVVSLLDLCTADVLDLAGRGIAGYTRLLRLQFLARRRLGAEESQRSTHDSAASSEQVAAQPIARGGGSRAEGATAVDASRVETDRALGVQTGSNAPIPAQDSTDLLESDVVIPHRPPVRRRADRSAPALTPPVVLRFSPSAEPQSPMSAPLQAELEQRALDRGAQSGIAQGGSEREDEGGSGPFA